MRRINTLVVSSVAVAAAALFTVPAGAQKIKVSTESVPVYVTVLDQEKRLVPDLAQEDFEVLDNGKPQNISVFLNTPTPITTIVMLDTSGSMTASIDLVKRAAEQFLMRLLPDDQGRVGAFNDKIEFHPASSFTSDRDELISLLKTLDFGYPTRLWDAADQSVARLEGIEGRKVVVLFTDGDDEGSHTSLGTVMDHAREKEVMFYGVGLVNVYFDGQRQRRSQPDHGLKKLCEDTGGGYFELKKTADLGETFTRVAQELHSQYVLGFSPETFDGKVHKLDVRLKKTGMTARARKSYVASHAAPTDPKNP